MIDPLPKLPPRDPRGHKGTFGTVCVLGGQVAPPRVMIGSVAFAANAALRSGAGLAVIAAPAPILPAVLTIAPGATGLALPVDDDQTLCPSGVAEMLDAHLGPDECLAVGPGLGAGSAQQQIIARLVANEDRPLVIDADGLNALAALRDFHADVKAPAVLTPHPGEFRRLAERLGIDADPVDPAARPEAAAELARRMGCVVVLKGPGTVVSDGQRTTINETGNAALATAGTGDVLTGLIAGLIAQFFVPHRPGARATRTRVSGDLGLHDCARLGVHLHGLAADRWAERHDGVGLVAGELVDLIPEAMARLRRDRA